MPITSRSHASLSVEDLLRLVLRSGLISKEDLTILLRGLPTEERSNTRAIIDYLIKNGRLTTFQANKLLSGTTKGLLLGPFEILAAIGRGGMSVVYLARDRRDGRLLALKILPPQKARREKRMIARFRREMKLCQQVRHPHLARAFEVGFQDGIYFIAMEYIPGRTLHRVVAQDGPLSISRAVHLIQEVASALHHAHQQGLIHRDMKPGNIMVTPHDHAKVLDLGFAMQQGESGELEVLGGQGYVVGTMDYIAPEQIDDATKVDARTDIYSLGCTLYFALTGQPPFPGGTSKDKMKKHRRATPTPLRQLAPHVPPDLEKIVNRMMAKDPRRRFASALAVQKTLAQWDNMTGSLSLEETLEKDYSNAVIALQVQEPEEELQQADEALFNQLESRAAPSRKNRRKNDREDEELQEVFDFAHLGSRGREQSFWERPLVYLSLGILVVILIMLVLILLDQ